MAGKLKLSDIFSDEFLSVITYYKGMIQNILDEYDIAIFMARKAVCLYTAMKLNDEFQETSCHVISSRVVDYGVLRRLRGKRIMVIDDVVVKGDSLREVASKLSAEKIEADYFVAACEAEFARKCSENGLGLQPFYRHYSRKNIYQLAGLITQYIEASMCSNNTDSPIYKIMEEKDNFRNFIDQFGAAVLTSGIQGKFGIESRVLYMRLGEDGEELLHDSILKIRFYLNDDRIVAVPFVLLPKCDYRRLEMLYDLVRSEKTDMFVECQNERCRDENMLKITSYLLSAMLMDVFMKRFGFGFEKYNGNDRIQFDCNDVDELMSDSMKLNLKQLFRSLEIQCRRFEMVKFHESMRCFYTFINGFVPENFYYEDCCGNWLGSNRELDKFARIVFAYEDLLENIMPEVDEEEKRMYVSSVVDACIDMGMIVPSIVHIKENGGIIRAYKMGEYSRLTRDQVNAFAKALYAYQSDINRDLDRIEFEKLCVLFFRTMTNLRLFVESVKYEENAYGIGYSLYGPRISTGQLPYAVDSNSVIITDFSENELLKEKNKKYYISRDIQIEDGDLEDACQLFASDYSKLEKIFAENPYKGTGENPWNQYVHTYNQYLTLLAIGLNPKNHLLSLCAELYLFRGIREDILYKDKEVLPVKSYQRVLSGIDSGLWKYRCFRNEAMKLTNDKIKERGGMAAFNGILKLHLNQFDHNPELNKQVDRCGELLYRIAFFLEEALFAQGRLNPYLTNCAYRHAGRRTNKPLIFSRSNYYYHKQSETRHQIGDFVSKCGCDGEYNEHLIRFYRKLQTEAKNMLDWCDLYFETGIVDSLLVSRLLLVISKSGNLPYELRCARAVYLEEVSVPKETLVYSVLDEDQLKKLIESILMELSETLEVEFIYIDLSTSESGFVQVGKKGKSHMLPGIVEDIKGNVDAIPQPIGNSLTCVFDGEPMELSDFAGIEVRKCGEKILKNGYTLTQFRLWREYKMESNEKVTNNFYGNIGQQQIGNHNTMIQNNGSVTVTNGIASEQLAPLLDEIRKLAEQMPENEKKEIVECVEVIEQEAVSEKPKMGLLRNTLRGLKMLCTNEQFLIAVAKVSELLKGIIE